MLLQEKPQSKEAENSISLGAVMKPFSYIHIYFGWQGERRKTERQLYNKSKKMGPCDMQQFTALQDTKTLNITDHLKVNQKTLGKWSRH